MSKVPDTDDQLTAIPREHYATCDDCGLHLQAWVPLLVMSEHHCASCVIKRKQEAAVRLNAVADTIIDGGLV